MLAAEFANAQHGIWSPEGEKILFFGQHALDQSSLDWYVVDIAGGTPVRTGALDVLREAGVAGAAIPGAWLRDGDAVIFATLDEGASSVWQVAISPSTGRVAGKPRRITFGTAIERSPSGSSTGRIAFASIVENLDIWRVPLDSETGAAKGDLERVTDNAARDRMYTVSADGRTMVFASSRTGRQEIWVRDLQTGRDRQITYSGARSARLSRNGSMIAVWRGPLQKPGIDLAVATGGAVSAVCDDCEPFDWSPDGSRLLIVRGTPLRMLVRELDSGRETELAAHPAWDLLQGRFSPDGRWVVFHTRNTPSHRQIYAVPTFVNGPVPVEDWIPVVTDFGVLPNWSPDGSAVYHVSLRDGAYCVWLQPVDRKTKLPVGGPRPVQHFHEPRLRLAEDSVINGDVRAGHLYATLAETTSNIWMLSR
jgi:Tol biopolymer transport system component